MRVVIAGGGTAGHVFPAVALGRRLEEDGVAVSFIGTAGGPEARIVADAGFAFDPIEASPFVRKPSFATMGLPVRSVRSVRACIPLVEGADAVVGMGGYVSVPAVVAAARTRRPLVLHEQNAVPGLANRWLARASRAVALSFPESAGQLPKRVRTVVTGNPVREDIAAVRERRDALAKEAVRELGLEEGRRTVVVFGGSQGALHVNRSTIGALGLLRAHDDLQVILLTGAAHLEAIRSQLPALKEPVVRLFGFVDRMDLVYAVADLVVARAGATSIAEITACGLPSLLIPYPYATGRHQEANARSLVRFGAAQVLPDEHVTPRVLADRIADLLGDDRRLRSMGERAAAAGRPDAAGALAEVVRQAERSR